MGVESIDSMSFIHKLHKQNIRNLYITLEIINSKGDVIDTVEGISTGGTINVSGDSLTRRSGSITMQCLDKLIPDKDSPIWVDNRIRVYVGIADNANVDKEVTHFCLGTFYITEPNINISNNATTISITLEDLMSNMDSTQLEEDIKFTPDTPLNVAVSGLLELIGIWDYDVEFTTLQIPSTKTYPRGTEISSIIQEFRDLYMDWTCYYDISGKFHFKQLQIQKSTDVEPNWVFKDTSDLRISMNKTYSYKTLKNIVSVYGKMGNDGITSKATAEITDTTSPFHKDIIGIKKSIIVDEDLRTDLQCDSKARYELFINSNMQEKITIETMPLYFLDVDDIISIPDLKEENKYELYIIDSISFGLETNAQSNITAHKLYFTDKYSENNSLLESYRKLSEGVIDGIMNKGWLYLSEQKVKQYYGIEAVNKPKLLIKFIYQEQYGVTASTTCYSYTKDQSMTIDLADFGTVNGENGDIGQSKLEYADRILGHEMVHAIMNDALGATKTILLPDWFKEGIADFIHGADERLKGLIVDSGSIVDSKIDFIVNRAIALMNGGIWKGDNTDYVSSYIAIKFIHHNLSSFKTMRTFFKTLISSTKSGIGVIEDAVISNTKYSSMSEMINDFTNNGKSYIYSLSLQVGEDELDTGSIGGSDHEGISSLNAEDVFNESIAIEGVPSTGFDVEFESI